VTTILLHHNAWCCVNTYSGGRGAVQYLYTYNGGARESIRLHAHLRRDANLFNYLKPSVLCLHTHTHTPTPHDHIISPPRQQKYGPVK